MSPRLEQIRRELAERSLKDFTRLAWPWIDKSEFVGGWHLDCIAEHLTAVNLGQIRRLMINIPPRCCKSTLVSVAWPCWTWAQDVDKVDPLSMLGPSTQFLYASYDQRLSTRDSVKCRRLMNSSWYRKNWGHNFNFATDQNVKTRFENDAMGYRISTSVDGQATGEGADIIVLDDVHSVRETESDIVREAVLTWWDETMSNRLNNPRTGAFVIIMQRIKEDDICGHILEREGADWTHLCLPARYDPTHPQRWKYDPRREDGELLWPARFDEKTLAKLEKTMGAYAVASQHQQLPAPREGGLFKREWFEKHMIRANEMPPIMRWVRHWDLAATDLDVNDTRGARTAGVKMGKTVDGKYVVTDCIAVGLEGSERDKLILATAAIDGPGVMISLPQDPGQAGKVQKGTFATLLDGYNVRVRREGDLGNKVQRAIPFAAQCEGGNVSFVRGAYIDEFVGEMTRFPGGRRKDIPDACSGAYAQLVTSREVDLVMDRPIIGPYIIERERAIPGYEA